MTKLITKSNDSKATSTRSAAPALALVLLLSACGKPPQVNSDTLAPSTITPGSDQTSTSTIPLGPIEVVAEDDNSVVHGRAEFTITNEQATAQMRAFRSLANLLLPSANAASSGSTTVTYTNAASTHFAINTSSFAPGTFTGDVLSLGTVALTSLSDNNLKVCGSGSTKCTQAIIRVYTTGSVAGFVNTVDLYGAPVFAGSLNPNLEVGLQAAGSVQVQTFTIPASRNTLRLSDFASPNYSVTSDFSNAGAGSYSMNFVVEYALQ